MLLQSHRPSATDALRQEHVRIIATLADVMRMIEDGEWERADSAFGEACADLRAHIDEEERELFVSFERKFGDTAGPTAALRDEHREIERLMLALAAALARCDLGVCSQRIASLHGLVLLHSSKEERVLFPTLDRAGVSDPATGKPVDRL